MLRSFTLALVMLCASCATSTAPPKSGTKVVALGVGSTLEMAKLEAIRSALSKTIPQYVVVDRQIIDDEVKKDIVTSTMNGYVSDVEILDQYTDDNGFVNVTLEVGVSERKIRDFIARFGTDANTPSGVQVDGENIAESIERQREINEAERRRREEQWTTATALSSRLFAGYPSPATEVAITDISYDSKDPDTLYITYAYDLNEEWRRKFWQKARTIDRLIADSGKSAVTEVCPTSRLGFPVMDNRCMRLPSSDTQVKFWSSYSSNDNTLSTHMMLVPIFDKSGAYLGCDQFQIDDGEIRGNSDNVRPSRAMVGPISPRFFNGFINFRHSGQLGRVRGPYNTTYEDYDYIALDRHFFIWGPDPEVFNFMGDDEDSIEITRDYKSDVFYNDTYVAEYFYPFIAVKKGGKFYRDLDADKGHKNYALLCREEGLIRHAKQR